MQPARWLLLGKGTRMEQVGRSLWNAIVITVAASFIGLVGLQLLFGAMPAPDMALLWLGLALLVSVCLAAATRPLASVVALTLARVPGQRPQTSVVLRTAVKETAWLVVATAYLVLIQAILRHPLVAAFGQSAAPFLIEATFAIFVLLVLLMMLGWMYRAARPLVEGAAREALDVTFVTASRELPEQVGSEYREPSRSPGRQMAATVVAPTARAPMAPSDTTVVATELTDRTQVRAEAR